MKWAEVLHVKPWLKHVACLIYVMSFQLDISEGCIVLESRKGTVALHFCFHAAFHLLLLRPAWQTYFKQQITLVWPTLIYYLHPATMIPTIFPTKCGVVVDKCDDILTLHIVSFCIFLLTWQRSRSRKIFQHNFFYISARCCGNFDKHCVNMQRSTFSNKTNFAN